MKKRALLTFFTLMSHMGISWAYDFQCSDLYYNITSDSTVEVTRSVNYLELANIVVPDSVTNNQVRYAVTSIGGSAFLGCSGLLSVSLGNLITNIDDKAFSGCSSLSDITIPESLINIGKDVFEDCNNMDYTFFINAYYIGNNDNPYVVLMEAKNKNITSCTINDKCKVIYDKAFDGCASLTEILIPNSVKCIGRYAFNGCTKLMSANIPIGVTSIRSYTFAECSLSYMFIPNSVKSIEDHAFYTSSINQGLSTVIIPNSVTSIGAWAFSSFRLKKVYIPYSVTSIGDFAFYGCHHIESVVFNTNAVGISFGINSNNEITSVFVGDSVTIINEKAFSNAINLKNVISLASIPPTLDGGDAFGYADVIYVRANSINAYKSAPIWKRKEILPLYEVKVTSANNKMGTVQGDSLLLAEKTLTFSAIPANGYHFVKWSDGNTDNPRSYSTASDTTFTAIFEAHTVVTDTTQAPTCTTIGLTDGKHCSVCN